MPMPKKSNVGSVAEELAAIKQLLIVSLIREGVKQKHIAAALGVHESQLSRSLPKGFAVAVKGGADGQ